MQTCSRIISYFVKNKLQTICFHTKIERNLIGLVILEIPVQIFLKCTSFPKIVQCYLLSRKM